MAEAWSTEQIEARIRLEALRQGVDPNLAVAVAKQESNLRADNPGDNGASRGVFHMQRAAAIDAGIDPARRDDPETGIVGGIRYLKQRLNLSKGNIEQALSRYNRGTPDYRGIGDPDYVYHVMRHYPGHPLGKEPTDQAGYAARLNRTFGRGTAEEGGERATMASQTTAEKPWWDKFLPRFGPRSAEAAEGPGASKWDAMFPGKPPSAAAPSPSPAPAPAPAESPAGSKWDTLFPGKPPESPPAAPPVQPEQAPLPTQPEVGSEAPAPTWRVSFNDPQAPPPTAASTPEQDAAYRASVGQGQPPPPTQNPQTEQLPPSPTPTPSAQEMRGVPPGTVLPTPPADAPLEEQNPAKEWAATGIEVGSGVAGSVAGTAVGGVPGFVAGGIAGQGYGSRLNKRLGLRPEEAPIATGFGMSLYPSDVLNAGFGLLTGGPALFKAALSKTTAGKTIVQAEMSAKEAYQAWQTQRKVLQEAQATGQEAKLNTALKDHATAEANYKRLVGERNETIAANKAEYDQAVKDFEQGVIQKHETKVAKDLAAEQGQAAAIPEAQVITKPYEAGTPSHVLYTEMRKDYSEKPLTLEGGQARLAELRATQPKTLAGEASPFPGEIETIAQGLETATEANVATVHEQLKKLGPLTRHKEGSIRGPAKQLAGILMDVLETAPEAAGAIKAANTRFKREMSLEDINDWLKPGHGVISTAKGKDTINPSAFVNKFRKEMADSKLFRDSFTPDEAATIEGNMRVLAEKTPRMPTRVLERPTAAQMQTMPGRPTLKDVPEVPPIYPESPTPGKIVPRGLTVPLEPPAKIPEAPASTSMWYPEARNKGDWIRKAPPKEGQWTREQWETYAKEQLGKKPRVRIMGALGGAGGMAFALQRMGFSPQAADASLWGVALGGLAGGFHKQGEWLLSRALLKDRYRPLLQEAMMDNKQLNPYFYNAMLAALTPEDKAEYDRMQRSQSQQKARR